MIWNPKKNYQLNVSFCSLNFKHKCLSLVSRSPISSFQHHFTHIYKFNLCSPSGIGCWYVPNHLLAVVLMTLLVVNDKFKKQDWWHQSLLVTEIKIVIKTVGNEMESTRRMYNYILSPYKFLSLFLFISLFEIFFFPLFGSDYVDWSWHYNVLSLLNIYTASRYQSLRSDHVWRNFYSTAKRNCASAKIIRKSWIQTWC